MVWPNICLSVCLEVSISRFLCVSMSVLQKASPVYLDMFLCVTGLSWLWIWKL